MGLFDIFKRNKEFENKKDDLFSIPCDYDGYDFVFKSNITNPSIYDEITKILTNDKISIKNMKEYKDLTINSDIDVFYEFYDKWMELLRNNKFVIHLDKYMDMNSFAKHINEVLLNIGCSDNIDEKEIVEKYKNELKKYSLDNKEIVDNINYDILQANVMAVELRKLGYELICFFSGFDNDDKTIIPINKINEFKRLEESNFDKTELIEEIEKNLKITLPKDYIEYFNENNGFTGVLNEKYYDLWKLEDIISLNEEYKVQEFFPNLVYFGSNGGDEAYAFDKSNNMCIVSIPFIGSEEDKKIIANNFREFINNDSKK